MKNISLLISLIFFSASASDMPRYLKVCHYDTLEDYNYGIPAGIIKIPLSPKITPAQIEHMVCKNTNSIGELMIGGSQVKYLHSSLRNKSISAIIDVRHDGDFQQFKDHLSFVSTDQEPLPVLTIPENENIR